MSRTQTKKIDFGKPYVVDSVELRDGIAQGLINGSVDELGCYVKRPGLTGFASIGSGSVPAIHESIDGTVIAICNGQPFTLDPFGSGTIWSGTKLTPDNQVKFAEDSANVFAAHGGEITRLHLSSRVASVVGGNAPTQNVTQIVFKDGYLLCNGEDQLSGDQYYSDDGANEYAASNSWELFNNEENPDPLTCIANKWGEIISCGPESIEWNEDDGVTPWGKMSVPPPGVGILAPYSMVDISNTLFFLTVFDHTPQIVRLEGRDIKPVSLQYNKLLATLNSRNAVAWGAAINQKPFYIITFPGDGITLAYNIITSQWSQFGYGAGTVPASFLMNSYCYVKGWNKHLVGDRRDTGKIFTFDGLTDDGDSIKFELTSGNVSWGTDRNKLSHNLLIKAKRGQSSDTSEPQCSIQFRDDGGKWQRPRKVSLGFAGDNQFFAVLYQLGTYMQRQYRIVHDDTHSDFILVSVEETFEVLNN